MSGREPSPGRRAPERVANERPTASEVPPIANAPVEPARDTDATASADRGTPSGRTGVVVATLALLAVGVWALLDTTGYSDVDSVVFPRTVAAALVALCLVALAQTWLRPPPAAGSSAVAARAPAWRPVLLVSSMLVAVALMGAIGFLPGALIAFAASLVAATHGRWSAGTLARHALAGLGIVLGFFALFSAGLKVPLP